MNRINKKQLILITGSNRSGTTWVGDILKSANNVNYIYEPFNIHYQKSKNNIKPPFSNHFHYVLDSESENVKEYINKFLCQKIQYKNVFQVRSSKYLLVAIKRVLRQLEYCIVDNRKHIIKDPIALFSAPWFYKVFNSSNIILIRHPAAYVASIKRVRWRSNPRDILSQTEFVNQYLQPLKEEIQDFKPANDNIVEEAVLRWKIYHLVIKCYMSEYPFIFIRHEDLCRDPIKEFKKLYKKLDFDFGGQVKEKIFQSTHASNNQDLDEKVHVLKRDSKKLIKSWKRQLTDQEISYIWENTKKLSHVFYSEKDW